MNNLTEADLGTHLDKIGLVAHLPDLRHIAQLLLYKGGLKGHKHEEREHTVVPVLIQAPQPHAEHLQRTEARWHIPHNWIQEISAHIDDIWGALHSNKCLFV